MYADLPAGSPHPAAAILAAAVADPALSWKAKGILAAIAHRALADTTVTSAELVAQGSDGRTAVQSALRELDAAGYLRRAPDRSAGRFAGYLYELATTPPTPGEASA